MFGDNTEYSAKGDTRGDVSKEDVDDGGQALDVESICEVTLVPR